MQRHRTDFVALFFGLAFLAGGTGFIVHQTTGRAVDATWIAAVALVSIGCIFLGATLLRGARPATVTPTSAVQQPPEPTATTTAPDAPDATVPTATTAADAADAPVDETPS